MVDGIRFSIGARAGRAASVSAISASAMPSAAPVLSGPPLRAADERVTMAGNLRELVVLPSHCCRRRSSRGSSTYSHSSLLGGKPSPMALSRVSSRICSRSFAFIIFACVADRSALAKTRARERRLPRRRGAVGDVGMGDTRDGGSQISLAQPQAKNRGDYWTTD